MKDQHTKITGYRDLSQGEIDAMNAVKEFERQGASLLRTLGALSHVDTRDLALARTHLEDACIRAVRAVARPATPY